MPCGYSNKKPHNKNTSILQAKVRNASKQTFKRTQVTRQRTIPPPTGLTARRRRSPNRNLSARSFCAHSRSPERNRVNRILTYIFKDFAYRARFQTCEFFPFLRNAIKLDVNYYRGDSRCSISFSIYKLRDKRNIKSGLSRFYNRRYRLSNIYSRHM